MSTHYIPKNLKGETRILLIFTVKSLITTALFALVGGIIFLILKSIKMTALGVIILAIFALMGYAIGTIKMPRITALKFTKNIEGDSIDEIVVRYIKFKMTRKVYSYTKEEE